MASVPILDSVLSAFWQISPLIINVLTALIAILVGFIVAKIVAYALTTALKFIKLDKGAKVVGFSALLDKGEIKRTLSDLIGDLFFWTIMVVTIVGVAKSFNLTLDPALSYILAYLGVVFIAAIVLGAGLFFATLVSGIVKVIASNLGIEGAKTLSRTIYYIVVIFTFMAALAQLGLKSDIFIPQIGVIIGAVGLAAAIAFGLGCKDMAADFLHNLFKGR